MFSFHPAPLPTKLRHQVWDLRITAMILAKVTKLQLMAFGSRTFQQTSCLLNHHNLSPPSHPPPQSAQGRAIISLFLRNIYQRGRRRGMILCILQRGEEA